MSRSTITTAAEAFGATLVTIGTAMWSVSAGFIVAGVAVMAGAYLVGDDE